MINKIFHLIQQAHVLSFIPRTHVKHFGNSSDSIASHSHHASVIAYCLSRMENLTHEEALKAVAMITFHDLAEARTGDLGFVEKHYATVNEELAVKDQFDGVAFNKDLQGLIDEYEERSTPIAKCAKDADSLQQIYTEWVLMWQGNKIAQIWFESDFNDRVPGLKTESAKKLAYAMKDSNPQEWWWSQFMKDDTAVNLENLLGKR